MQAANRVVLNTGMLYGRMMITIGVSLFSTRLVLNALGASDYGIFNLVSGVIIMLSFLNSAMALSTQRYLSFYLGADDEEKLRKIFNSSVLLHLVMGIVLVLLFELLGGYLFDHVLNIPAGRIGTAKIIFHFVVSSTFFTIISVPYDASLMAHENMTLLAILGVLESLMKLAIAVYLIYTPYDKLITYGALMAAMTILLLLFKRGYCYLKYKESRSGLLQYYDKSMLKEMFSYAGWNMFGAGSYVAKNQGIAMILNVFFGAVINAAYGIATQVNAQLSYFSVTMLQSLNPQIIKSEGRGDRQRMLRLAMVACRFSFYLLAFFSLPVLIEMPLILKLWLKNVPDHTIIFCRLIIVVSLVNQLSSGIQVAIQSIGKIRAYQVIVSTLLMSNLPVAYLLLKAGLPPWSVLAGSIFLECVAAVYRACAAKRIAGLSPADYLIRTAGGAVLPVLLAAAITSMPQLFLEEGLLRLFTTCCLSVAAICSCIRLFGLTPYESEKVETIIMKFVSKLQARFPVIKTS